MCAMTNFELPRDVELAFIAIHGTFGEDGQVQKILENARRSPTRAKTWREAESPSTRFSRRKSSMPPASRLRTGRSSRQAQRPTMALPFVIKAPRQGSTVGVYIVKK